MVSYSLSADIQIYMEYASHISITAIVGIVNLNSRCKQMLYGTENLGFCQHINLCFFGCSNFLILCVKSKNWYRIILLIISKHLQAPFCKILLTDQPICMSAGWRMALGPSHPPCSSNIKLHCTIALRRFLYPYKSVIWPPIGLTVSVF